MTLLRTLFSTPLFLVSGLVCNAQLQGEFRLDSLIKALPAMQDDTQKVNVLDEICFEYKNINPDEGIKYGMQQMALAKKLNWVRGIANSYSRIGSNYIYKSDYPKALEYNLKALATYETISDKAGIAIMLGNIGNVYLRQNDHTHALDYYMKALRMNEELKYAKGIALNLGSIGQSFSSQGKYDQALEFLLKAAKMNEETGNKSNVAIIYGMLGNVYKNMEDYPTAFNYFDKACILADEMGDKNGLSRYLGNIGAAYLSIAKNKSFFESKKVNEFGTKAGLLRSAIAYTDSSIRLKKETRDLEGLFRKYKDMSEIYELVGDNEKALESYKNYTLLKDSVFNIEKDKKLTQTAMQYEFDKREAAAKAEQEKKDIRQRNIRNSISAGLGGAIIFLVVVYRQRNKIKAGKKRSDELLLNILPSEVAEELKAKGTAEAKQFDEVTVLFTDFKSFTQISEMLTPAELVNEIHACFKAFDDIIGQYNIEKIKTIGDAYMAAGGLPVPTDDSVRNTVLAAIAMSDFMLTRKREREEEGKIPFEMRVGIHTGPVVAGIVGVKKFQYDIWGDTVNTASRMESSSEAGKVNISETTYEVIKNNPAFSFKSRGRIEARGKGEIGMWFVEKNL